MVLQDIKGLTGPSLKSVLFTEETGNPFTVSDDVTQIFDYTKRRIRNT